MKMSEGKATSIRFYQSEDDSRRKLQNRHFIEDFTGTPYYIAVGTINILFMKLPTLSEVPGVLLQLRSERR
jgi:hypothetical protein